MKEEIKRSKEIILRDNNHISYREEKKALNGLILEIGIRYDSSSLEVVEGSIEYLLYMGFRYYLYIGEGVSDFGRPRFPLRYGEWGKGGYVIALGVKEEIFKELMRRRSADVPTGKLIMKKKR